MGPCRKHARPRALPGASTLTGQLVRLGVRRNSPSFTAVMAALGGFAYPSGERIAGRQYRALAGAHDGFTAGTSPDSATRGAQVRNVRFLQQSADSGAYPGCEDMPICRVLGALPWPLSLLAIFGTRMNPRDRRAQDRDSQWGAGPFRAPSPNAETA